MTKCKAKQNADRAKRSRFDVVIWDPIVLTASLCWLILQVVILGTHRG